MQSNVKPKLQSEEEIELLAKEIKRMLGQEFEPDVIQEIPMQKQKRFGKLKEALSRRSFYNPDIEDYEFEK